MVNVSKYVLNAEYATVNAIICLVLIAIKLCLQSILNESNDDVIEYDELKFNDSSFQLEYVKLE